MHDNSDYLLVAISNAKNVIDYLHSNGYYNERKSSFSSLKRDVYYEIEKHFFLDGFYEELSDEIKDIIAKETQNIFHRINCSLNTSDVKTMYGLEELDVFTLAINYIENYGYRIDYEQRYRIEMILYGVGVCKSNDDILGEVLLDIKIDFMSPTDYSDFLFEHNVKLCKDFILRVC